MTSSPMFGMLSIQLCRVVGTLTVSSIKYTNIRYDNDMSLSCFNFFVENLKTRNEKQQNRTTHIHTNFHFQSNLKKIEKIQN